MDRFGQLRIYVSAKYLPLFQEMTKSQLFTQNSEFFLFCTFVGNKYNKRSEVEKRSELCQALTLSDYDRIAIETLYLQENDSISHMKDVIHLAEQYANGGLEYLLNGALSELTYTDASGHWHVKSDLSQD